MEGVLSTEVVRCMAAMGNIGHHRVEHGGCAEPWLVMDEQGLNEQNLHGGRLGCICGCPAGLNMEPRQICSADVWAASGIYGRSARLNMELGKICPAGVRAASADVRCRRAELPEFPLPGR
ncbi:hypothetical protein Dimus_018559 [Dionaea muscipula]